MLTTYTGDVQVLRALKAGAWGYLLKNSLHKELLERSARSTPGKGAPLRLPSSLPGMSPMTR